MQDRKKFCPVCGWRIPEGAPLSLCLGCVFGELVSDPANNALIANQILTTGVDANGSPMQTYRLVRELGRGGMGLVWEAEQLVPLKRTVAFKLIKRGWKAERTLNRFEAERQRLATLQHQNIAKIFDAGTLVDGRPFFTMELVQGCPITEFADRLKLSIRQRIELFIPVCNAIQHAHQKGIIHRDIKPQNVLVSGSSEEHVPKVIDFGISKVVGPEISLEPSNGESAVAGTLEYMAPEQFDRSGPESDTRTDVYGLGALFYEMLVGTPPFGRRSTSLTADASIRYRIETEQPVPPSKLAVDPKVAACRGKSPSRLSWDISRDIDLIVLKALSKDPGSRYEGADGFALDLRSVLQNKPVEARPDPGTGYELLKLIQRHMFLFLAGISILVTSALGVLGFLWQGGKVTEERRAKEQVNANLELHRAASYLAAGDVALGFGELGKVIHEYPTHPVATKQIASAMRLTSFTLPMGASSISNLLGFEPGTNGQAGATQWRVDGQVVTLLAQDGKTPKLPLITHPSQVVTVSASPSGKFLATGCQDGSVRIWNVASSLPLGAPLNHSQSIVKVQFASDAQLLCFDDLGAVHRWGIISAERSLHKVKSGIGVEGMRWAQSNRTCLVLYSDGAGRLWDIQSGAPVTQRVLNLYDPDGLVGLDDGGNHVFAVDTDGTLRITSCRDPNLPIQWLATTSVPERAKAIRRTNLLAVLSGDQRSVEISWTSNPRRSVTVEGGDRFLFNARPGEPPHVVYPRFVSIHASSDGRYLLGLMDRDESSLFDLTQSHPTNILNNASPYGTVQVIRRQFPSGDFSPDNRLVLFSTAFGFSVLRVENGAPVPNIGSPSATNSPLAILPFLGVRFVRFLNDSRHLVTVSQSGHVATWDVETGVSEQLPSPGWEITYSALDSEREHLTLANRQGLLLVVDLRSRKVICSVALHPGAITASWLIANQGWLITLEEGGLLRLWDFASPDSARVSAQMGSVQSQLPVDSPLSVHVEGNMARLHLPSGAPSPALFMSHFGLINHAELSSDRSLVLTCSSDGTSRIWDAETGFPVSIPMVHGAAVRTGWFIGDGRSVATSSDDGWLYFWDTGLPPQGTREGLPTIADAIAGLRIGSDGTPSSIGADDRLAGLRSLHSALPNFLDDWIGERFFRLVP